MVIGSARDIMAAVKAPRAVFVNFPLGHNTGKPFDRELQMSIVRDALAALATIEQPGTIEDLPYQWSEDDFWERPGGTSVGD